MQYIRRTSDFYKPYQINGKKVNNILFFNENGVIAQVGHGWLENENKADIKCIQVTNVKECKGFSKQECKEQFLNKMFTSKEPLNFTINVREPYSSELELDLYLYVDNDFIKVLETTDKDEPYISEFSLTKTIFHTRTVKVQVYDEIAVMHYTVDRTEVNTKKYQNMLDNMYEELKNNSIYVEKSKLAQVMMKYKLVKRPNDLLQ